MQHITVLLDEAVDALALRPASVVVDATLGASGHAQVITRSLDKASTFIGFDADAASIEHAKAVLDTPATVHLVHQNFAHFDTALDTLGIGTVDAVLADLGWRIEQFTTAGRGFSFTDDVGLAMTYGDPKLYSFTAEDIVNDWEESDIANVLFGYGEEHYARRIAKAIVEARQIKRITTGLALATIITAAVPATYRRGRLHPATKSFQGLRIAVNDEFTVLETFIASAFTRLAPGGRLAIITFHSLEDRIVKLAFRSFTHDQTGVLVHKKPIVPTREAISHNLRARSAKLRIIEKL
jgi:16S rRNA (cytosine1402-N4)-methyltransferase